MAVFLYSGGEKNNLERCIMIAKLLTEQSESSENSHSVTMSPERWEPARTHDAKLACRRSPEGSDPQKESGCF